MLYKTKPLLAFTAIILCIAMLKAPGLLAQSTPDKALHQLFDSYYEDFLKLYPLAATQRGDARYNNLLPNTGSKAFIKSAHDFNAKYRQELKKINYSLLSPDDKTSYDILMVMLTRELEGERFHQEFMPANQIFSLHLTMGQLGSGTGSQPFKTVKDYDNWLKRITAFTVWADTAIANFKKGLQAGVVLPKALVVKMIPQMETLAQSEVTKSVFYGPINKLPQEFAENDKARLTEAYQKAISNELNPAYKRLSDFLKNEYLPKARTTSGTSALPDGKYRYDHDIYFYTTTRKTPEEIYQTGLREVARITGEMEKIKASIGFKGTLKELFEFMRTDQQFMPFKTEEEVLNAYRAVQTKIQPQVKNLFNLTPKSPFEIRPTEAFRAASAAPQYNTPSEDGSRPGIFYVPIVDPAKINVTGWEMESVFLHEAIPGHHYQLALQQENLNLPRFRRFGFFPVFSEGWGLYVESLGEELGCYTDPYHKIGALGTEIHRAIRLVVDVGIHTGKMSREEAIQYMLDHEALSEQSATAEIERYMARPGQALAYKTGELKIKELKSRYQKSLGAKFNIKSFHDAILLGGAMPLDVFEKYMDAWAKEQRI